MIKAAILAAGKGTRLRPLTDKKPKPAIRLLEENILQHNLRELSGIVKEAVIVVGYKNKIIEESIGESFAGIKIKYVKQKKIAGTGSASLLALPYLGEEFLIINGDDLYFREDIEKCLKKNPSILLKKIDNPSNYGQVCIRGKRVEKIVEKPKETMSNLINIGCYFINKSFFREKIEKSSRGEYEITDFLKNYIKKEKLYFSVAKKWIPVTYPWSIFDATKELLKKVEEKRKGKIEKGAKISGKVVLEKGSIIKKGAKIEGPLYVGKNTIISSGVVIKKGTVIHDNCFLEEDVEVENTIIFSNTKIKKRAILRHSVIGEKCLIGEDVFLKDFFSNGKKICSDINGKKVDTKREKMGAVIGGSSKIKKSFSTLPGTIINSKTKII